MLREEIKKLAAENPELRAHLLPLLKKEAAGKLWKQWGEITQSPEGNISLKVSLRNGSSAAALWRKFAIAYTQRKLNVSYDDKVLTISIGKFGLEEDI